MWEQRPLAMWTSWSNPGLRLIPTFSIPMPNPMVGWRRACFLLRNDTNVPLSVFMGGHPVPQPNWEYNVARAYLHRLQPLLEVVWGLLQRGSMGVEILQTFFSCAVQPLQQREATMQTFLVPSCPVRPSSTESGSTEINTQVGGSPAPGISLNLGFGAAPLRERDEYHWMSLPGMALSCLHQPPLLIISIPMQDLGRARGAPWGVSLLEDAVRREALHAYSEWLRSRR
jgi:hypothetical protein